MIKREEVAGWLEHANDGYTLRLMPDELAELARTWLAVDGAQSAEITREDWLENFTQIGADMIGQRVKLVLVPEADSGGEG